ncbi:hypothetical protein ACNOYE_27935 [Nannocystaceae bacterium ST9]
MQNNLTRWQVVVQSIKTVTQDGSFLSQNTHLALMRFGHDPSAAAGALIPNDSSGVIDCQQLDDPWYDAQNDPWYECNGVTIGAVDEVGAPINGSAAASEDAGERTHLNVVVTDGAWTGVDGTTLLAPANQNPSITAVDLFDNNDVRTYVVAVAGDVDGEVAADPLATAGGTGPTDEKRNACGDGKGQLNWPKLVPTIVTGRQLSTLYVRKCARDLASHLISLMFTISKERHDLC